MDFGFSAEQQQYLRSLREFLAAGRTTGLSDIEFEAHEAVTLTGR